MMIKAGQDVVFSVDSRGVAAQMDLTVSRELVRQHAAAQAARQSAESARCAAVLDAAAIPEECGPDIVASPARGGFVLHRIFEAVTDDEGQLQIVRSGYGHRAAIHVADIFDRMQAQSLRAKRPMALSAGQVAVGRHYRDLVQALDADGYNLSSLQGRTSSAGSSDGGDWMDRRLQMSAELDRMRRRIGNGVALQMRRVRPSKRAVVAAGEDPRCLFSDQDIIDLVCVQDMSCGDVLRHFRWQSDGRNRKVLMEALSGALTRMIGYLR